MINKKQNSNNILAEEETKLAIERLIEFCNLSNSHIFLELSSKNQEVILRNILLNKDKKIISQIVIFGSEASLDDFDNNFGKSYLKIKLLTELCAEYYTYLSVPLNIEEFKEALIDIKFRKNPFLNLEKINKEFRSLFNNYKDYESFLGKGNYDFFIIAGDNLKKRADPKARQIEYHGEVRRAPQLKQKFLSQILDIVYANILHSKECKQFNILWIDNNPGRELSAIDDRFKEFIKPNIKLEVLLHKIEYSFENYSLFIYDNKKDENAFKELKLYLETQEKDQNKLFARRAQRKEYVKISIKDFNFILIDIFLGEQFDGVDLLKLFTIHFPEIPAFILSVSDDYYTIASTIQEGADYYILKTQVLSIPYTYYQYLNEIGEIISFLKS